MINIDWDWVTPVSVWQTTATISILIVAIFIVVRMLMRFWPWLRKVMALFDALAKLPKFIVDVMAFIEKVVKYMHDNNEAIGEIRHELTTNNGSSVKDAVKRVEIGVVGLHEKVDEQKVALDAADAALRHDFEDTVPLVRKPKKKGVENE